MAVVASPVESDRFGVSVGRWERGDLAVDVQACGLDVVIVRRSAAENVQAAAATSTIDGYVAVHADTLMYWEWVDDGADFGLPDEVALIRSSSKAELGGLVRDVFADYQNHYTANPLFDRAAALEGYVEWAHTVVDASPDGFVAIEARGEVAGFAVVDWHADVADIRLAGICQAARRRGLYRQLMQSVMRVSRDHGVDRLAISTQAQNLVVQRGWAALGWRPFDSFDTTHLIRRELLT